MTHAPARPFPRALPRAGAATGFGAREAAWRKDGVPEKKIVAEIESRREVKAASGELRLTRCAAPAPRVPIFCCTARGAGGGGWDAAPRAPRTLWAAA
jgi:hypothetical protein